MLWKILTQTQSSPLTHRNNMRSHSEVLVHSKSNQSPVYHSPTSLPLLPNLQPSLFNPFCVYSSSTPYQAFMIYDWLFLLGSILAGKAAAATPPGVQYKIQNSNGQEQQHTSKIRTPRLKNITTKEHHDQRTCASPSLYSGLGNCEVTPDCMSCGLCVGF